MRTKLSQIRGRSPRTRGSPPPIHANNPPQRSIPADAGEPLGSWCLGRCRRVDPRGRGGAARRSRSRAATWGRSPRTRGSRDRCAARGRFPGSIPADAGEPRSAARPAALAEVDPRGRGGAGWARATWSDSPGRSPRTRGSRRFRVAFCVLVGSIPADAGEPPPGADAGSAGRVDPRGRGGAASDATDDVLATGRSPRTRGSQPHERARQRHRGSIPADAGEPRRRAGSPSTGRVDPRGRGGARPRALFSRCSLGRSPRTRGSHSE